MPLTTVSGKLPLIITNIEHLKVKKMDAQQLHDHIIKPTLQYMGGNYDSKDARFLLLCTAAIESKCGYYIKQINGPALGVWQMEPATLRSIYFHCDALKVESFDEKLGKLAYPTNEFRINKSVLLSPMSACAMARLKYSMDKAPLPDHHDIKAVYDYYKRIYNTPAGASTYEKFCSALANCKIEQVKL
jgi:hypothetical protein